MNMQEETYLGDGLYVSWDKEVQQIKLRAPRVGGDHEVYMELEVIDNFLKFLEGVGVSYEGGGGKEDVSSG